MVGVRLSFRPDLFLPLCASVYFDKAQHKSASTVLSTASVAHFFFPSFLPFPHGRGSAFFPTRFISSPLCLCVSVAHFFFPCFLPLPHGRGSACGHPLVFPPTLYFPLRASAPPREIFPLLSAPISLPLRVLRALCGESLSRSGHQVNQLFDVP